MVKRWVAENIINSFNSSFDDVFNAKLQKAMNEDLIGKRSLADQALEEHKSGLRTEEDRRTAADSLVREKKSTDEAWQAFQSEVQSTVPEPEQGKYLNYPRTAAGLAQAQGVLQRTRETETGRVTREREQTKTLEERKYKEGREDVAHQRALEVAGAKEKTAAADKPKTAKEIITDALNYAKTRETERREGAEKLMAEYRSTAAGKQQLKNDPKGYREQMAQYEKLSGLDENAKKDVIYWLRQSRMQNPEATDSLLQIYDKGEVGGVGGAQVDPQQAQDAKSALEEIKANNAKLAAIIEQLMAGMK